MHALFPTGFHNRFKVPHKIVLNRYQRLSSKIYDAATDEAITLKLNAFSNTMQSETYYGMITVFGKIDDIGGVKVFK